MLTRYEVLTIRSALCPKKRKQKGLITASAGNHAQGVAYAAKAYWCKGNHRYADNHTADQSKPYQRATAQKWFFTAMYTMRPVHMRMSWQKSTDIPLSIRSMIWTVATGQGTIAMEIIKELPTGRLYPGSDRRRRTGYRCFHSGKTAESEDQSDRCRTGRSKLYAGIPERRRSCDSSERQYNCRRYCSKDARASKSSRTSRRMWMISSPSRTDELIVAFLDMVENHKMIVENSGLLTVAALKHLNVKGKKVVSILSGGNMDVITMSSVVQHGLIQRDRIFTVSVLLPDKPGELVQCCNHHCRRTGQCHQTGSQPVYQHQPKRRQWNLR